MGRGISSRPISSSMSLCIKKADRPFGWQPPARIRPSSLPNKPPIDWGASIWKSDRVYTGRGTPRSPMQIRIGFISTLSVIFAIRRPCENSSRWRPSQARRLLSPLRGALGRILAFGIGPLSSTRPCSMPMRAKSYPSQPWFGYKSRLGTATFSVLWQGPYFPPAASTGLLSGPISNLSETPPGPMNIAPELVSCIQASRWLPFYFMTLFARPSTPATPTGSLTCWQANYLPIGSPRPKSRSGVIFFFGVS